MVKRPDLVNLSDSETALASLPVSLDHLPVALSVTAPPS